MKRCARGWAVVCLAVAVANSIAAGDDSLGLWLDVPFIPQRTEGCGAAALSMVMHYWSGKDGLPPPAAADADAIYRALHSSKARGIVAPDLVAYAKKAGYRTFAFAGEWSDLRRHLSKGQPLIVALKPERGDTQHYVVVVGMDAGDQTVLFNDPAGQKLERVPRSRFEPQWNAMRNWTLLALPLPNP